MPSFSNSGRDDPNDLQQAIHGLVAEFFEMLGDGEAGSLTMLFFVYIYTGWPENGTKNCMSKNDT